MRLFQRKTMGGRHVTTDRAAHPSDQRPGRNRDDVQVALLDGDEDLEVVGE